MLVRFFLLLKSAGVPVSITELLTLLEALQAGLAECSASDDFYYLSPRLPGEGRAPSTTSSTASSAYFKGARQPQSN